MYQIYVEYALQSYKENIVLTFELHKNSRLVESLSTYLLYIYILQIIFHYHLHFYLYRIIMLYFSYSFVSYKGINEVKGIHICFVVTVVEIVNREDKVKGFMTALHKIIQITE